LQIPTGNLDRLRKLVRESGVDAIVAASPENVPYIAGVLIGTQRFFRERLAIVLWPSDRDPTFIVCDLERELARSGTWIADLRSYVEFQQSPIAALIEAIREKGLERGRIGIEYRYLLAPFWDELKQGLPQAAWVHADALLKEMRVLKTPAEIALLERCNRATEEAHLATYRGMAAGETEKEVSDRLFLNILRSGADEVAFCYLNAGARTGMRHLRPGDYRLQAGDLVKCDAGGYYQGYYSDVARTVALGRPHPDQRDTYRKVHEVHRACLEAVRPGVAASEVYRVQKEGFARFGLPFAVPHVGHGIGLEAHEIPLLAPLTTREFEPNMVIAVETRHLIPNREGYHVEDILLVTERGARILTAREGTDDLLVVD
jgi:Xaa-Pro aminopeptidase